MHTSQPSYHSQETTPTLVNDIGSHNLMTVRPLRWPQNVLILWKFHIAQHSVANLTKLHPNCSRNIIIIYKYNILFTKVPRIANYFLRAGVGRKVNFQLKLNYFYCMCTMDAGENPSLRLWVDWERPCLRPHVSYQNVYLKLYCTHFLNRSSPSPT